MSASPLNDLLGRPLRDLRLSVTDRCNFRCPYCKPAEVFGPYDPRVSEPSVLSFDELVRLARLFVSEGVRKIRLTGGEPLLRARLEDLVAQLAAIPGVEDLALTTNGWLLTRHAKALSAAGLRRVTVSLDAMDDVVFSRMAGQPRGVAPVIRGVDAALNAGLGVKVNTVLRRGWNEGELLPLAEFARKHRLVLRFIEFMDVGNCNGWRREEVVPSREIFETLDRTFGLRPVGRAYRGEVADRYVYADMPLEVGLISSVSQPFCRDCTRARLTSDGRMVTCLFASAGTGMNLAALLRAGADDAALQAAIRRAWGLRDDRYSELRGQAVAPAVLPKTEMSYLGG